ncbi:MAG TPA: TetR/AcrR family transcriptional regulator [Kofleriaceae bacterium]|nr:TetR/AcrR family transcriptional regulator [Kofleriaceae bacterium]
MPRLRQETLDAIQRRIESAALAHFIKAGYTATTTRDIAQSVGLTPGALYSHYESKEALFAAVVLRYQRELVGNHADNALTRVLKSSQFPHDIPELAAAIRELVSNNKPYWLLWYIDIVEFEGKHFRTQVAPKALLGAPELKQRFEELRTAGALRMEPELAFVMVYMHLFNYFCVEALFGGSDHYGVPEDKAVTTVTDAFLHGILAAPAPALADEPAS